jgi:hypothetical protein
LLLCRKPALLILRSDLVDVCLSLDSFGLLDSLIVLRADDLFLGFGTIVVLLESGLSLWIPSRCSSDQCWSSSV